MSHGMFVMPCLETTGNDQALHPPYSLVTVRSWAALQCRLNQLRSPLSISSNTLPHLVRPSRLLRTVLS